MLFFYQKSNFCENSVFQCHSRKKSKASTRFFRQPSYLRLQSWKTYTYSFIRVALSIRIEEEKYNIKRLKSRRPSQAIRVSLYVKFLIKI